ncbi:MAG: ComF family protein [Candidatus Omnitrophica bacterium]|nr:ComF family protein [Candidatus Omnitrophota bacterium]
MFTDFLETLVGLVYPPNCFTCKTPLYPRSPKGILCPKCLSQINFNLPPFCPKCSRHINNKIPRARCRLCAKNEPEFDFAWSACLYDETLKALVHAFKYRQKTGLRVLFGELMKTFVEKYSLDIAQFDIIVPIPLYSASLRERSYNQAELLARYISSAFDKNISVGNLIKIRPTKDQVVLSQKERWTNVQGAFRIKKPDGFKNKAILIIDDLLTTGATSSEAAVELKKSGAEIVGVFTLAIA